MKFKIPQKTYVVLYNVRSIHNVGSVFRTADCLGVSEIILVGYTPTPLDRFGRPRKDFIKVSLGAEKSFPWKHFFSAVRALQFLKSNNVSSVAVEQHATALDYRKVKPKFPAAFWFGSEVGGIPAPVLNNCDAIAEIPMHGSKESLNVSVAAGIALARMLSR